MSLRGVVPDELPAGTRVKWTRYGAHLTGYVVEDDPKGQRAKVRAESGRRGVHGVDRLSLITVWEPYSRLEVIP